MSTGTPCLDWTGRLSPEGYGRLTGRENVYAHRAAYERTKGPIPEGMQIDHLCGNRQCVNPDHLEAVDQRTNILRGTSPAAQHARQTHCLRGHEFDGTRRAPSGRRWRTCSECQRIRDRVAYRQARGIA